MPGDKEPVSHFVMSGSMPSQIRQKPGGKLNKAKVAEFEREFVEPVMTEFIQELADSLVARLTDDLSIAPPRAGDDDGRAVTAWMDQYRAHFIEVLAELLVLAAGPAASEKSTVRRHERAREVAEKVLPQVETELRRFALGRTALRWGGRYYPNFVDFGRPEFMADERHWIIPLEYARAHRTIGQITLDNEGNVIESQTTTRAEARQALMHAA